MASSPNAGSVTRTTRRGASRSALDPRPRAAVGALARAPRAPRARNGSTDTSRPETAVSRARPRRRAGRGTSARDPRARRPERRPSSGPDRCREGTAAARTQTRGPRRPRAAQHAQDHCRPVIRCRRGRTARGDEALGGARCVRVPAPRDPPGEERLAAGAHGVAHRLGHQRRIARVRDGRVHEHPVAPDLHGDGRVAGRPHAGVDDDGDLRSAPG